MQMEIKLLQEARLSMIDISVSHEGQQLQRLSGKKKYEKECEVHVY